MQVSELCGQRTLLVFASDASLAATASGSVFLWGGGESNIPVALERTDLTHIALGNAVYGLTRDHSLWVRPVGSLEEQNCRGQEFSSSDVMMLSAAGNMLMGIAPGNAFCDTQQHDMPQAEEHDARPRSESMENEVERDNSQENASRKKRVSFSEVVERFAIQVGCKQQNGIFAIFAPAEIKAMAFSEASPFILGNVGQRTVPHTCGSLRSQAADGKASRRNAPDVAQNPKTRTMSVPPSRKAKPAAATPSCTRTRSLSPADQRGNSSAYAQPCLRKTAAAERAKGRLPGSATATDKGGPKTRTTATETTEMVHISRSTTGGSVQDTTELERGRVLATNGMAADDEIFSDSRNLNTLTEPEAQSPQHYSQSHHSTPEFGFTPAGVPIGGSPSNANLVENAAAEAPWQPPYETNPIMQHRQNNEGNHTVGGHDGSLGRQDMQQLPSVQQHNAHGRPLAAPPPPPQLQQQQQQPQVPPHPYYQPQQAQQMRPPQFQNESGLQEHPCTPPSHLYNNLHSNYPQNSMVPWDSEYEVRRRMGMGMPVQGPGVDMQPRPDLAALALGLEMQREASRVSLASTAASSAYEAQLQSLRLKDLPLVTAGREAAIGGELAAQKEASELRKALSL